MHVHRFLHVYTKRLPTAVLQVNKLIKHTYVHIQAKVSPAAKIFRRKQLKWDRILKALLKTLTHENAWVQ